MEISFGVYDNSEKRWHSKAVKHALNSINEKITQVEPALEIDDLCAKFDSFKGNTIKIEEEISKNGVFTSVYFITNNWDSLSESLDDCEKQLACALQAILSNMKKYSASKQMLEIFGDTYQTAYSRRKIKDDGLSDIYWYIEQKMNVSEFFSLIDELEAFLSIRGLGEVSGNSYSVSEVSSCIDIVAPQDKDVLSAIKEFATKSGIEKYEFGGEYA